MQQLGAKSLRTALQGAVNQRLSALRNGRSYRKDQERLRAAIGRAESFLNSYPVASDERTRDWCIAHIEDVRLIVPGNAPTVLARLIMEDLKSKTKESPELALRVVKAASRADTERAA